MANKIISISSGWVVLISTVIFLVFGMTVLPDQSAKASVYSGSTGSPDLSLLYSPDDLYRMAEGFGAIGRKSYVQARFTFDLAFPLIYGAFFLFSSAWSLGKLVNQTSRWRLLVFIPALAVLFDLLENAAASITIARFPQPSQLAASVAPLFTLMKWVFVSGSFALSLTLLCLIIWKGLKK